MCYILKIDLSKLTFLKGENSSISKNHSAGVNKVKFENMSLTNLQCKVISNRVGWNFYLLHRFIGEGN